MNILVKSASKGLHLQIEDGSMPKGTNGPWEENMTHVRNTSHWAILFINAYHITKDMSFYVAAQRCGEYLLKEELRPYGFTYLNRIDSPKNKCNGLIGQAWIIEALITLGDNFKDERYIKMGQFIFDLHEFDYSKGLWRIKEIDGYNGGLSRTFNQQLWFAVIAAKLYKINPSKPLSEKIIVFQKKIKSNLRISKQGRIKHLTSKPQLGGRIITPLREFKHRKEQFELSIGYHTFNLYGFALLYKYSSDVNLWNSNMNSIVKNTICYVKTEEYLNNIIDNKYGSQYNPFGFEISVAIKVFEEELQLKNVSRDIEKYLDFQINNHYSNSTELMSMNTIDKDTLSARLYEVVPLIVS